MVSVVWLSILFEVCCDIVWVKLRFWMWLCVLVVFMLVWVRECVVFLKWFWVVFKLFCVLLSVLIVVLVVFSVFLMLVFDVILIVSILFNWVVIFCVLMFIDCFVFEFDWNLSELFLDNNGLLVKFVCLMVWEIFFCNCVILDWIVWWLLLFKILLLDCKVSLWMWFILLLMLFKLFFVICVSEILL